MSCVECDKPQVGEHMTADRRDDQQQERPAVTKGRRPWTRPSLTAYGPIGKLTQGGSGGKGDGTANKKK